MSRKPEPNGVEPDFSEDDIQRERFGPRGVPGAPDPAKMTPQRETKTPKYIDQGHTSNCRPYGSGVQWARSGTCVLRAVDVPEVRL